LSITQYLTPSPFPTGDIMAKTTTESAATTAPTEKLTQKEAVKRALAAGKNRPSDGVEFIKNTFGMELTKGGFSTLKTHLKKTNGTTGGSGKRRGRPAGSSSAAALALAVPNGKPHKASSNPADLARAVKHLVAEYGVEAVSDMTKVFAE
jgi:hypothetical protein